mmetsp:Transcript_2284/g.4090  ORF Transcript_2284/g.4090 Transcript_2284/m.4090 type:complete len:570 (-) Transcript_2284:14-1723(-)
MSLLLLDNCARFEGRQRSSSRISSSKPRRSLNMILVDGKDKKSFSSARVSSVASSDVANNKKHYPLPPPRGKGMNNRSTPSHQSKIDEMKKKARVHDISYHTGDTTYAAASTSSLNVVSASSQPSKHPSPICATRVPVIASTSSFTPARYSKPNAIRPPPPPRQSQKPLEYSPLSPRSISNDSHHLTMQLVNSKISLPSPSNVATVSSPKSHKIPARHTLRNVHEEFNKSQLYPPPPKGRRSSRTAIISRGADDALVLTRAYPKVQNNKTRPRRRNQEKSSDHENNMSNLTLLNGKTNIPVATAAATPGGKPQEASFLSKTRKQLSHAQGVTAHANPPSNSQHSKSIQQNQQQLDILGFRQDYTLGEAARSPSHMIIEGNSEKAMKAVNSLSIHDFAFVKRSDGLFHYAILAFRSNEQGDSTSNQSLEECMTFVLSDLGCTKMIKKSQWSEFVRLSSTNNGCNKDPTLPTVTANTLPMQQDKARQHAHGSHDRNNDQDVKSNHEVEDYLNKLRTEFYSTRGPATVGLPPSTISFDTTEDDMISCVSVPCDFSNERLETKYKQSQYTILE